MGQIMSRRKQEGNRKKEISACCDTLRTTPTRWIHIRDYGCSDPSWPDGCNMNLLRNHMRYAKRTIDKLCLENGFETPPEMDIPIPPYVDENYFSDPNSERAKKIRAFGQNCNFEQPCCFWEMKAYQNAGQKAAATENRQLYFWG